MIVIVMERVSGNQVYEKSFNFKKEKEPGRHGTHWRNAKDQVSRTGQVTPHNMTENNIHIYDIQ